MQKVIIAGSMAVLASGATKTHSTKKMNSKLMANLKAQMKETKTQSASSAVTMASLPAVSALRGGVRMRGKRGKGKGKGRGDDDENGDDGNTGGGMGVFEITFSDSNTCEELRTVTYGYELGLCMNYVDLSGIPNSMHYVPGPSGTTPYAEAFLGYGCQGTAAATTYFDLKDLGFPEGYVIGDCVDSGEGFFTKAYYADEMHYPDYDAVLRGVGVDPASCKESFLLDYDITPAPAGACFEDNEDGSFFSYDLTSCESGSITYMTFSDDACTVPTGEPENWSTRSCILDIEYFKESLEFHYTTEDCHVESA